MTEGSAALHAEALFAIPGRRALVTGGSSGIGLMVAEALLANGAEVVVAARDEGRLEQAVGQLGAVGPCSGVPADVATPGGRARLAEVCAGGLDILVNNAGVALPESPAGADPERAAEMLALNVTAPLLLTQALLDPLRSSAGAQDPSRVVMMGSVDGIRVPAAPLFTYGASKAALHSLTRHLAQTLAGDHITVNAVAAGMFESAMTAGMLAAPGMQERIESAIPLGRIGAPADIAAAVLHLCGPGGSYMTGTVIPVDGGVSTGHQ